MLLKTGYAKVLALVALVAISGFASADRLPQQVPENQVFSIDTLIDCIGPVSQKTTLQWTLDSQGLDRTRRTGNSGAALVYAPILGAGGIWGLSPAPSATANEQTISAAIRAHSGVTFITAGAPGARTVQVLDVPTSKLNTMVDPLLLPGVTFGDIINLIDATAAGTYDNSDWTDSGSIHDSMLNPTEEIMILTFTDSIRTNGGHLSLNENIDFDSSNKGKGLSNLEVEKVLTYNSVDGSHLVGAEEWSLDVAGSFEPSGNSIRCVFAQASSETFPAFCNVVKARSELININSAQISTKGSARGVAATGDIPSALSYQIAVTPDSGSGSGFAEGTVKTLFAGSIMEARDDHLTPSATNNWKDSTSVTGGIKNFQKSFNYESGFKF